MRTKSARVRPLHGNLRIQESSKSRTVFMIRENFSDLIPGIIGRNKNSCPWMVYQEGLGQTVAFVTNATGGA